MALPSTVAGHARPILLVLLVTAGAWAWTVTGEAGWDCSDAVEGECVGDLGDESAQAQLRARQRTRPSATSAATERAEEAERQLPGLEPGARPVVTRTPPPKDARIGIIGAGRAGLHMASQLKALGHSRVTVLERSDRIGGKAFSIDLNEKGEPCQQGAGAGGSSATCVTYDLSATSLHHGFHVVRALLKQYGLRPLAPAGASAVRSNLTAAGEYLSMDDFLIRVAEDYVDRNVLTPPQWVNAFSSALTAVSVLLEEARRYNSLHRSLLWGVSMSLPVRPTEKALSKLTMSLKDFLRDNNLLLLEELLVIALPLNGYGYIDAIPAYHGLLYATPEFINGFVQEVLNSALEKLFSSGVSPEALKKMSHYIAAFLLGADQGEVETWMQVLPDGWEKLWARMLEQDGLDVRLNVEIAHHGIKRNLLSQDAPVTVTYYQAGKEKATLEFDILMYTAPHALASGLVSDLMPWEQHIFHDLVASTTVTTLYRSGAVPGYSTQAAGKAAYVDAGMLGRDVDGGWYSDRHPRAGLPSTAPNGTRQVRVAFQHFEDPCRHEFREELCGWDWLASSSSPFSTPLPRQAEALASAVEKAGGSDVEVLGQVPWTTWRYSERGLREGHPWSLFSMQGTAKTYWLGASAVFDSVHDVMNYNHLILKRDFGAVIKGHTATQAPISPDKTSTNHTES